MKLTREDRLAALLKLKDIIDSGYAGVLPNGHIVDRRDYPAAIPIPANGMLNTPAPKPINAEAERRAEESGGQH